MTLKRSVSKLRHVGESLNWQTRCDMCTKRLHPQQMAAILRFVMLARGHRSETYLAIALDIKCRVGASNASLFTRHADDQ